MLRREHGREGIGPERAFEGFRVEANISGERWGSTFVAIGALLGIKSVRGDAEHIVALDADTVDHGADDGLWPGRFEQTHWMGIRDFFGVRLSCHGAILPYGNFISHMMFEKLMAKAAGYSALKTGGAGQVQPFNESAKFFKS